MFFILQSVCYLRRGVYAGTKKELLALLEGKDKHVLEIAVGMAEAQKYDFDKVFEILFSWCRETKSDIGNKIKARRLPRFYLIPNIRLLNQPHSIVPYCRLAMYMRLQLKDISVRLMHCILYRKKTVEP